MIQITSPCNKKEFFIKKVNQFSFSVVYLLSFCLLHLIKGFSKQLHCWSHVKVSAIFYGMMFRPALFPFKITNFSFKVKMLVLTWVEIENSIQSATIMDSPPFLIKMFRQIEDVFYFHGYIRTFLNKRWSILVLVSVPKTYVASFVRAIFRRMFLLKVVEFCATIPTTF